MSRRAHFWICRLFLVALCLAALLPSPTAADPRSEIFVVPNLPHADMGTLVALSPDDARLVSGAGRTLKLWNTHTGQLLRTFIVEDASISAVAFSVDGVFVLAGSGDGLRRWSATTGKLDLHIRPKTDNPVEFTQSWFSPDMKLVLTMNSDFKLQLWDVSSGRPVRPLTGKRNLSVSKAAFTLDARRVVTSGMRARGKGHVPDLTLWDTDTGRVLRELPGVDDLIESIAITDDGINVALGLFGGAIELRSLPTGRLLRTLRGHGGAVEALTFSRDGRRLTSGSADKTMKVWDMTSGQPLRSLTHERPVLAVAMAADGRHAVSGGDAVQLWDVQAGRSIRSFSRRGAVTPTTIAFTPDGGTLTSAYEDGTVRSWSAETGRLLRTVAGPFGIRPSDRTETGDRVLDGGLDQHRTAFSPDHERVATVAAGGGGFKLWNARTGQLLRDFPDRDAVYALTFSADGREILSGSGKLLKLWSADSGQLLRSFAGHTGYVSAVAFSNSGREVAAAGADTTVIIWDRESGQRRQDIKWDVNLAYQAVSFARDDTHLLLNKFGDWPPALFRRTDAKVAASYAGQAVKPLPFVVNAVSMEQLGDIMFPKNVLTVAFSPDGRQVATGGKDMAVRLFETDTGRLLRSMSGHSGVIAALAFSPDGRLLATAGQDATIRIWAVAPSDATTAIESRPLVTLVGGEKAMGSWLSLTPDGFFAGTPAGAEALTVVRGLETFDASRLYQALYEPNLVREQLDGDREGEVANAARALDLAAVLDSGQPPFVELDDPGTSSDELLPLRARIADQGGGIGRIEWRVDGITVGVSETIASTSGNVSVATRAIALGPGENHVEVVAYNARNLMASSPATRTVTRPPSANQPKPRLFVIAAAVDGYSDTIYGRLSHAVADAKAFAEAMRAGGRDLYAEVDVTLALDADVTAARLAEIFTAIGSRMHARDTFVLFIAAHGKMENGRFHVIPFDYRSESGRSLKDAAIGQDQLQALLANHVPARHGLILLDTCESGALVGRAGGRPGETDNAGFGRLNEATGRPVLTAAAADQVALEGYKGHGVFTYALLHALANGDSNGNGLIEINELAEHIQALAPRLSQELRTALVDVRQKPQIGSRGEDFALVRRLPPARQ